MDTGTYNCRDYEFSPHFAAATITNPSRHAYLQRHESWADLEHRSRSPASMMPKFPLLRLPLELRQQILLYLLPHTQELGSHVDPLETHVRNFSAVQKRVRKGMELPPTKHAAPQPRKSTGVPSNVAWRRGNTSLFAVCRQLHDECADLVYGGNTFMLGVTFSKITFRFRYLLPSGMAPQREYAFIELMPERYLRRLRRIMVSVDHVDSYTGMIKYNVSGKGLVHGLRRQVLRLVGALQPVDAEDMATDKSTEEQGLARVIIRISNENAVMQSLKAQFGEVQKISEDIEEILEPFGHFRGVRDPRVLGAVGQGYARELEERMRSLEPLEDQACCCGGGMADVAVDEKPVQLCVYGNDI
ncbi:hypothetical protein WHR41_00564 [Cladosporium halotolerans]|uniref:F-box domain-containing protein n=1 Tax=Cladosporium halotolerans TaxID=1052096 RepID=A0AB34L2K2_9PEZI